MKVSITKMFLGIFLLGNFSVLSETLNKNQQQIKEFFFTEKNLTHYTNLVWDAKKEKPKITYDAHKNAQILLGSKETYEIAYHKKPFTKKEGSIHRMAFHFSLIPKYILASGM